MKRYNQDMIQEFYIIMKSDEMNITVVSLLVYYGDSINEISLMTSLSIYVPEIIFRTWKLATIINQGYIS